MDIALDLDQSSPTYGDLSLEAADFGLVDDKAAIQQDMLTALRVFLGECFMDNTIGIDFFGQVLIKNPDQGKIDAIFINVLLTQVPGVAALNTYAFTPRFLARQIGISFQAQTIAGIVDYTGTINS